ncbi:MAG: WG repeat-containing protein [Nitrospirota bacterium]
MAKFVFILIVIGLLIISCSRTERQGVKAGKVGQQDLEPINVGEKWGFQDVSTKKIVIEPKFDNYCGVPWSPFREGMVAVSVSGKWGFIDKTGQIIIKPKFDFACNFREGLALVNIGGKPLKRPCWDIVETWECIEGGKWGYINKIGDIVIDIKFKYAWHFAEGLAEVSIDGKKWGYIDKTGNYVITPKFDTTDDHVLNVFSEGLARVKIAEKFGFIDKTGKVIINPQYNDAHPFAEEVAAVKVGEKWGFINKTGKMIIRPQFGEVHHPYEIVEIGATEDAIYYFFPNSIMFPGKDIVKIWVEKYPRREYQEREIKEKGLSEESLPTNYEHYGYRKELFEINCFGKKIRIMAVVDYDIEGNIIDSHSYSSNRDWSYIIPGSIDEEIYKTFQQKQ